MSTNLRLGVKFGAHADYIVKLEQRKTTTDIKENCVGLTGEALEKKISEISKEHLITAKANLQKQAINAFKLTLDSHELMYGIKALESGFTKVEKMLFQELSKKATTNSLSNGQQPPIKV